MRFKLLGFVVTTTLASITSYALSPVRDEEFLCGTTHVVVGTVVDAHRVEWEKDLENACRNETWHCPSFSTCQNIPQQIYLRIKVNDVLAVTTKTTLPVSAPYTGVSMKTVLAGQTIDVATGLWNNACSSVAYDAQGLLAADPPGKGESITTSVSPRLLRDIYVGKTFIFSLTAARPIGDDQNASPPYNPSQPFNAYVYRMSRATWVRDTLKQIDGVNCPKLVTRN